ncbi:tRNA uridine-5-carboxymethylaminomethyl(34) synthesis GTPase MnmE [Candidatus Phytoplasma pini]|uniref:tRNA modification GTPase MnmE n=1 Tax=Candidatus Phytoplasma pini TaxID=267362 RepID=A0A559KK26_9MOLU|nr:tRNA uridine-5-carboxymethylaminomethyl(34) synthesis GTPase MnmE [Candidatus Phytoplasma pini]TVY12448.1 tRNA modification GTPase trmE [Candidatus Phytoplasma pini]
MFFEDTIAAIATPLGTGSISVIRVSGYESIEKINQIFITKNKKKKLLFVSSHTIHHGFILDEEENILDEVLISVFRAPHSFTGENVIEVCGHGGILITQLLLERILSLDIRLAKPGEFSKRAFLNQKIDLIQAEAMMDLIHAQNEKTIKLSQKGLQKKTSILIQNLIQEIIDLLGKIEVNIDYPEYYDIQFITNDIILPQIKLLIQKLKQILDDSVKTRLVKKGIKTLIIGKPNVGKSSLLNNFLNKEKAIVTDIAGTTRDFVDGYVNIEGISLFLIDTAGIRETQNPIEQIGIEKTKKLLEQAELVLLLYDQSSTLESIDYELLELTQKYLRIIIGSKSDLPTKSKINLANKKEEIVFISNINHKGIEVLKKKILKMFQLDKIEDKDFNYFSNSRHIQQIKIALKALQNIEIDIEKKIPIDMHTISLKEAYSALSEIIGNNISNNTNDCLINELFSKFCLGK